MLSDLEQAAVGFEKAAGQIVLKYTISSEVTGDNCALYGGWSDIYL